MVAFLATEALVDRGTGPLPCRVAVGQAVLWCALGVGFGGAVWAARGPAAAGEYCASYVKSLSLEHVIVFALIFSYFRVPPEHQHRVLFWGVLLALAFRGGVILTKAGLLGEFRWATYALAALLTYRGVRTLLHREVHVRPDRNVVLRLMRRFVPMTDGFRGRAFVVTENGRRAATPLLAVLLVVETADIVFAIDEIPAILSITRDTLTIFAANVLGVLGVRALYFVLASVADRFAYFNFGMGLLLLFSAFKMWTKGGIHVSPWATLAVMVTVLAGAIAASLIKSRPVGAGQAAG